MPGGRALPGGGRQSLLGLDLAAGGPGGAGACARVELEAPKLEVVTRLVLRLPSGLRGRDRRTPDFEAESLRAHVLAARGRRLDPEAIPRLNAGRLGRRSHPIVGALDRAERLDGLPLHRHRRPDASVPKRLGDTAGDLGGLRHRLRELALRIMVGTGGPRPLEELGGACPAAPRLLPAHLLGHREQLFGAGAELVPLVGLAREASGVGIECLGGGRLGGLAGLLLLGRRSAGGNPHETERSDPARPHTKLEHRDRIAAAATCGQLLSSAPVTRNVAGRYELVRVIGQGGMGAVYEALHVTTRRRVALKLMHPHVAHDAAAATRFVREAQAPAQIDHPGIVDVLDAGTDGDGGPPFLVMELLDGEDLAHRFARLGADVVAKLALVDALLDPLAAAHANGFVHRDLKPENAFVARRRDGSESVKLLDFGLVRTAAATTVTQTGTAMGTAYYMSPEQWRSTRDVGPAADVWSVGVMLYEAVSGTFPYAGETAADVMIRACTESHVPLSTRVPRTPPALAALVDCCLEKDPTRRLPDAGAVRAQLRTVLAAFEPRAIPEPAVNPPSVAVPTPHLPAPSPSPVGPASVLARWGGNRWRKRALGAGAVALASAIVFLILGGVLSGRPLSLEGSATATDLSATTLSIRSAPDAHVVAIWAGETLVGTTDGDGRLDLVFVLGGYRHGAHSDVVDLSARDEVLFFWSRSATATVRVPRPEQESALGRTAETDLTDAVHVDGPGGSWDDSVEIDGTPIGLVRLSRAPIADDGVVELRVTGERGIEVTVGSERLDLDGGERSVRIDVDQLLPTAPVAEVANGHASKVVLPLEVRRGVERASGSIQLSGTRLGERVAALLAPVRTGPLSLRGAELGGQTIAVLLRPSEDDASREPTVFRALHLFGAGPLEGVRLVGIVTHAYRAAASCAYSGYQIRRIAVRRQFRDETVRVFDARTGTLLGLRTFRGRSEECPFSITQESEGEVWYLEPDREAVESFVRELAPP